VESALRGNSGARPIGANGVSALGICAPSLLSAAAAATPPTPASISRRFIIVTFSCSFRGLLSFRAKPFCHSERSEESRPRFANASHGRDPSLASLARDDIDYAASFV
jgi:hypothetical protein